MTGECDGRDSDGGGREIGDGGGGLPPVREVRGATGVGWRAVGSRAGEECKVMGGPVGRRMRWKREK